MMTDFDGGDDGMRYGGGGGRHNASEQTMSFFISSL